MSNFYPDGLKVFLQSGVWSNQGSLLGTQHNVYYQLMSPDFVFDPTHTFARDQTNFLDYSVMSTPASAYSLPTRYLDADSTNTYLKASSVTHTPTATWNSMLIYFYTTWYVLQGAPGTEVYAPLFHLEWPTEQPGGVFTTIAFTDDVVAIL